MSFEIPEQGSADFVELLCLLDQARYENAREWIVVVVDPESGEVINGYGPFEQAEQALAEAGVQAAWWAENEPDEPASKYQIVPLWGPGE